MTKKDILDLIATDELEQVAAMMLDWARQADAADLHGDALIQAGRLEALKKARLQGNMSEERRGVERNDIRVALVEMLERLPDTPAAAARMQPGGMNESAFKMLVFGSMVVGNLIAFVCLFVLGEGAGGFSPPEAATTATMLISVFSAYFSVMLSEFIARRNATKPLVQPRVSRRFLSISVGLLLCYFVGVSWLILRRPLMEFTTFMYWLTAFESALGLFVGQIVHNLFRREAQTRIEVIG